MIFGDAVRLPATAAPAEWIAGACRGASGTVGGLVPNQYPLVLRVPAPDPDVEDWWSAYRELFAGIVAVGERHTSSADRAWLAVWEGHGFGTRRRQIGRLGPLDDATCDLLERERVRLRGEDERHNAAVLAALREVPRFELPHRVYYLLAGPVTAATALRDPGTLDDWRRPDLFWPDDRRWFVATDVDFWSLYVGGADDTISELARRVPSSEIVTLDHWLEPED